MNQKKTPKPAADLPQDLNLTQEDIKLIQHCRRQRWGELTVKLKGGRPVMITRALEDIKLDGDEKA